VSWRCPPGSPALSSILLAAIYNHHKPPQSFMKRYSSLLASAWLDSAAQYATADIAFAGAALVVIQAVRLLTRRVS
jgi:hypothetical protein